MKFIRKNPVKNDGPSSLDELMAEHDAENRRIGRAFAIIFILGCAADVWAWWF